MSRDVSGPSQPTEYKAPSGARASRRVAGAAPEVQLRFGCDCVPSLLIVPTVWPKTTQSESSLRHTSHIGSWIRREMQKPVEYAAGPSRGSKQRTAGTSTAPSPENTGGATADSEQSPKKEAVAGGVDSAACTNVDTTGEAEYTEVQKSGDVEEDGNKRESQEQVSESEKMEPDPAETEKMDSEEADGNADESVTRAASASSNASAAALLAPALASVTSGEAKSEETFVSEAALNQLLDRCCTLQRVPLQPSFLALCTRSVSRVPCVLRLA